MRNAVTLLFPLLLQAMASPPAVSKGTICAKVIDQDNRPISGARVALDYADARAGMGALQECITGAEGTCSKELSFGGYHVVARKKSAGYPDLLANFYGHGEWPVTTEITAKKPKAVVIVRLGPKAGFLVLQITDDKTGKAIAHASVTLHPAKDPHDLLGTSLDSSDPIVLLPPDEDVLVTVSADGYQPWNLKDHPDLSPGGMAHLHSDERSEMTVRLKHQ